MEDIHFPACSYDSLISTHASHADLSLARTVFKNEIYLLSALLFYVAFYFIGKKLNETRANSWYVLGILISVHFP